MRADRLVAIVLLLQARGGMSAPELARHLEVSVRTIYRDLDSLSAAGVPVWCERGPNGGVRLVDGYRTDLTGLNAGEAEALFALGMPGPLDELGLGAAAEAARRKLLAALSPSGRTEAERGLQRVHVDAASWSRVPGQLPHLALIVRALWADRGLRIEYVRADNSQVGRHVNPLGLVLKAGEWYLVGLAIRAVRVFRVSRMRSVALRDETFDRPADFDLASFWQEWLADFEARLTSVSVHVRVSGAFADELPRFLGEGVRLQILDARPDRDGRLTLDVDFDSLDHARRVLLGLGPDVEVLAPEALREDLRSAAGEVALVYGGPAP